MMKNKKMGILAVLVMLVAVTLNAVGGTYAKYISSYGTTDEARVAKWDFRDETVREVDLFQQSYTTGDDKHTYVASSDMYKVIAPGTNGSYGYSIAGTAETNFKVDKNVKIVNKVWLDTATGEKYNPVEFTLDNGTTWIRLGVTKGADGNVIGKFDSELGAYVYEDTTEGTDVYAANTVLTGSDAITGSIGWRWVFDKACTTTEGVETCEYPYSNDIYDTELGTQIDKTAPQFTIKAEIGVSVVQTEEAATIGTAEIASTSINLNDAELRSMVETYGYDANNASLSFDGKTIKGTAKAYSTDSKLFEKYNVSTANPYFGLVKVTVPTGYKLYATSLYESGEKEIAVDPADNAALVILSFKSTTGKGSSTYELRKGSEVKQFEIAYDVTLQP